MSGGGDLDDKLGWLPGKVDSARFELGRVMVSTLQGEVMAAVDTTRMTPVIVKRASRICVKRGLSKKGIPLKENFLSELKTHMILSKPTDGSTVDPGPFFSHLTISK